MAALQVEMGEMPLDCRREQLLLTYWANLRGHRESHPGLNVLKPCQEKEKGQFTSFGWIAESVAQRIGISQLSMSPTVPIAAVPPWFLREPVVDLSLLRRKKCSCSNVNSYIGRRYSDSVVIYTDASRVSDGRVGVAFVIPDIGVCIKKRTSDNIAVYTAELLAILLALNWVEENGTGKFAIASDSNSAVISIKNLRSETREDIVNEIGQVLERVCRQGKQVKFLWVPAHIGVEGNELADKYAKGGAIKMEVDFPIKHCRAEVKTIVKEEMRKKWQREWDACLKGRFYYTIQRRVEVKVSEWSCRSRKEEDVLARLRLGHSGLNGTLRIMGKHETGECEYCRVQEDVEHVIMFCPKFWQQRRVLEQRVNDSRVGFDIKGLLQGISQEMIGRALIKYLKSTRLIDRV